MQGNTVKDCIIGALDLVLHLNGATHSPPEDTEHRDFPTVLTDEQRRRVASRARTAGLGEGYSGHPGRLGLATRMTCGGAPPQAVQTHGRWKSPATPARYTRGRRRLRRLSGSDGGSGSFLYIRQFIA